LLAPTLVVGVVAIMLLQNEQKRIEEISISSVEEKGQTIVDNIDLNMSELKAGFMESLATLPRKAIAIELQNWKTDNGNISEIFLATPEGGIILPSNTDSQSSQSSTQPTQSYTSVDQSIWMRNGEFVWSDSNKRETFQNTISNSSNPYFNGREQISAQYLANPDNTQQKELQIPQQRVADNTAQQAADQQSNTPIQQRQLAVQQGSLNAPLTINDANYANQKINRGRKGLKQTTQSAFNNLDIGNNIMRQNEWDPNEIKLEQGWVYAEENGKLQIAGWLRLSPQDSIRGIVISLDAIIEDILSAFPLNLRNGEMYCLLNTRDDLIHRAGGSSAALTEYRPASNILIGDELPGWKLAIYRLNGSYFQQSFFLIGSVLVAILLISTLTAGTLLMRQAQKNSLEVARKTSFISNVSHELKTPLTSIRMYAEMLGEGRVRETAKKQNYLHVIITESQRLTRLVNNVLDFSRLEQGRKNFQLQTQNITTLVKNILDSQQMRLDDANMRLNMTMPDEIVLVNIDHDAFKQVMLNLIDNAIKYAKFGGQLDVEVRVDDKIVTVCVEDAGEGVPPAQHEEIFEVFHRVDDSLTNRQPGAGLGLSIARRLIRGIGGDLRYKATREQSGACFEIILPLCA